MKAIALHAVNTIGEPVKLAKDATSFTDEKSYFKVTINSNGKSINVVTPKGGYTLYKHATLNIYQGRCFNNVVHVSLKKIVGELRYW